MTARKFLAVLYWAILVYLLFFAFYRDGTNTVVNLIPLKTISELTYNIFVIGNDWKHWVINIVGNVLVFIPFLPSINSFKTKKISFSFAVVISICVPITIEILQFIFQIGSADIDDVILNCIGILCGFFIIRKIERQPAK